MIFQTLRTLFWVALALFFWSVLAEIPTECVVGSPNYNETLCNVTCAKDIHSNESYCANFTQPTASIQIQPQKQEAVAPVALSEIISTPQEGIRVDLTTPKIDLNDVLSSGISLDSSLKGSIVASFSVLLFAYF